MKMFNWFKKTKLFERKTVIGVRDDGKQARFKVHRGNQIWFSWFGYPFPCRMENDGSLTVLLEGLKGTGKKMLGWTWKPDDHSTECPNADY